MAYVGQTGRPIKNRINEHRSNIKLYQTKIEKTKKIEEGVEGKNKKFGETTVARHFFEKGHKVSDLKWMILESIMADNDHQIKNKLLQREVYWICTLGTLQPHGMNENCNFSVFL